VTSNNTNNRWEQPWVSLTVVGLILNSWWEGASPTITVGVGNSYLLKTKIT